MARASRKPRPPRPEVLAFLEAIKDAPEDAPRLVFADWLQEHGDASDAARGEYLRLECELARLPHGDVHREELQRRAAALWQAHRRAWCGEIFPMGQVGVSGRGLLVLRGRAQTLISEASRQAGDSEAFAWVDTLDLETASPNTVQKLAASPLLDGLNALRLAGREVRAAGVEALANGRGLRKLHTLDLYMNHIGPDGAKVLAGAPFAERLRVLRLGRNMLSPESVRVLAHSRYLRHLRELDLHFHDLAGGAPFLAEAPWLSGLEVLNLSEARVSDADRLRLSAKADLKSLRKLDLHASPFGASGLEALLGALAGGRLEMIDLCNTPVGDAGLRALAASPVANQLREVRMIRTGVTSEGALAAVGLSRWEALRSLDLRWNVLSPEARQALRERFGVRVLLLDG